MKILLVEPYENKKTISPCLLEPLDLEYIAASLENLAEIQIIDLRLDKDLEKTLKSFKPSIVGIFSMLKTISISKEIARRVRQFDRDILTIITGPGTIVSFPNIMDDNINLLIMNNNIETLKKVIYKYSLNQEFGTIKGIAFRKNGKIILNEMEEIDDLSAFPFPNRELTSKYRKYYSFAYFKPLASIRTTRGCSFHCNFCFYNVMQELTKMSYQSRSAESIVDELENIKERDVFFADCDAIFDSQKMYILADLIKKRRIRKRYLFYARSDSIIKHSYLLKIWKEIGLQLVNVGFESYRIEELKKINKEITPSQNELAAKILNSLGIDLYAYFMAFQNYDINDFKELQKYTKKINADFCFFTVFTPIPHTQLFEQMKDEIIIHDFDFFDYTHTYLNTKLPLKKFYCELAHLYKHNVTLQKAVLSLLKYPLYRLPSAILKAIFSVYHIRNTFRDYKKDTNFDKQVLRELKTGV